MDKYTSNIKMNEAKKINVNKKRKDLNRWFPLKFHITSGGYSAEFRDTFAGSRIGKLLDIAIQTEMLLYAISNKL